MEITINREVTEIIPETFDIKVGQVWHRRDGGVVVITEVEEDRGQRLLISGFVFIDSNGNLGNIWYGKDGRTSLSDQKWDLSRPVTKDDRCAHYAFDKPDES